MLGTFLNGTHLFLDQKLMVDVATDACQMAAAGYFWGDWFYQHFLLDSPASDPLHIAHKETLAMVLAAKRWGRKWSNCCDSSK